MLDPLTFILNVIHKWYADNEMWAMYCIVLVGNVALWMVLSAFLAGVPLSTAFWLD
jgi:hypothetical protein